MTKRNIFIIIGIILAAVAFGIYWKNFRGMNIFFKPIAEQLPSDDSERKKPSVNTTGLPLTLLNGVSISIFAENLPNARVIAFDDHGNAWVSQPAQGTVSQLEIKDGKVVSQNAVFRGLNNPHGLAFDPENPTTLYIAEENKISSVKIYSEDGLHKIADLPEGGGHFTRTIGFGPDRRLYVSIGSSCNVCSEKDNRRAKIFSMNPDGSDFREYAHGLRNAVFFTWKDGQMWATEMGRDYLGDNLPPDEINIIKEGRDYGWPNCYGNKVADGKVDCSQTEGNAVDIPAHSAPLGLAFIGDDLLVAYHGSWNRSTPTGYKIVRMKFDRKGNYQNTENFITGWQQGGNLYGRPVDIVKGPDDALYITDDKAGLIYRVIY